MNRMERISVRVAKPKTPQQRVVKVDKGRGRVPPPSRIHKDRKKEESKNRCRGRLEDCDE